jgi:hypothetical protein
MTISEVAAAFRRAEVRERVWRGYVVIQPSLIHNDGTGGHSSTIGQQLCVVEKKERRL